MRSRGIVRSTTALIAVTALAVFAGLAESAEATNGYFIHGYGTTNKGLAGAGAALPQDALTVATNPAGLAFLDKRYDAGLAFFNPNRQYSIDGNPSGFPGTFGLIPGTVDSDSEFFGIPHFATKWALGANRSLDLAIYGHPGFGVRRIAPRNRR